MRSGKADEVAIILDPDFLQMKVRGMISYVNFGLVLLTKCFEMRQETKWPSS
jgi:hypothetical protein